MAVFVGEFEQNLDAKKRLAIPMALREQMDPEEDGRDFILVLSPERHLWLYPATAYKRLLARLRPSPLPDRGHRKTRLMFAMARLVKPDKQGRIVLPDQSLQRSTISQREKVTLVGDFDHIEIWPREEWETHVTERLPVYGEMLYDAADRLREEESRRTD